MPDPYPRKQTHIACLGPSNPVAGFVARQSTVVAKHISDQLESGNPGMAFAAPPEWYSGHGCYRIVPTTLAFAGGVVPEEQLIPFNLESVVVRRDGEIVIYPRVLHGDVLPVDAVFSATRVYTTYTEFVFADSDDPNAAPASVPFIQATCGYFMGYDRVDYYSFGVLLNTRQGDPMTTRFVQENIPPAIAPSRFDSTGFEDVRWFRGSGVYKVTYTDVFKLEHGVSDTEAGIDYNRHVAVFDTELEAGPTLVLCYRMHPYVMTQSADKWFVMRYIESAEKTEHDVSWFLRDPAPPINDSHVYPLEQWNNFAQLIPEPASTQVTDFCRNVLKNPVYTRYMHRRLRSRLGLHRDTVSLQSAILRREAERYQAGGEATVGDREAYRSSLPAGARHVFDRYTSVRFYV